MTEEQKITTEWEIKLEIGKFEEYEPVKFDLNTEDREIWANRFKFKATEYFRAEEFEKALEYFQKSLTLIEWDS